MDSFSSPALAIGSMLILVPAALGGAWAGITRRYRLAAVLFAVPVVILLYVWFAFVVEV